MGLSPRMRGNPDWPGLRRSPLGSIPAYAGEPGTRGSPPDARQVYPRVCGGTAPRVPEPHGGQRLSPRMRGNRPPCAGTTRGAASIPAYAGEPSPGAEPPHSYHVYPRVCGGTNG